MCFTVLGSIHYLREGVGKMTSNFLVARKGGGVCNFFCQRGG